MHFKISRLAGNSIARLEEKSKREDRPSPIISLARHSISSGTSLQEGQVFLILVMA